MNKIKYFFTLQKLIIYKINNKVPSTEPCATPHLTCNISDIQSHTSTYCICLLK